MTYQPRRLLRLPEVKHQIGLGRTSIYSMIKAGEFPSPVSIGARAVAWDSAEVEAWIKSRIQAAQGGV